MYWKIESGNWGIDKFYKPFNADTIQIVEKNRKQEMGICNQGIFFLDLNTYFCQLFKITIPITIVKRIS